MNVDDAQSYADTSSYNSRVASNDNSAASMNNLFMTLLVAQIQNQDPLNPTDGTEYVSQLAQLSQVQSMESMSALMQNNAVLMDNLQTLSTGNLVGQKVMVQTDKIETDGSTVIDGRLSLEHAAGVVTNVRIPLDGSATMLNIAGLGEVPYNYISQFGMNSPSNNTDTRKA